MAKRKPITLSNLAQQSKEQGSSLGGGAITPRQTMMIRAAQSRLFYGEQIIYKDYPYMENVGYQIREGVASIDDDVDYLKQWLQRSSPLDGRIQILYYPEMTLNGKKGVGFIVGQNRYDYKNVYVNKIMTDEEIVAATENFESKISLFDGDDKIGTFDVKPYFGHQRPELIDVNKEYAHQAAYFMLSYMISNDSRAHAMPGDYIIYDKDSDNWIAFDSEGKKKEHNQGKEWRKIEVV